MLSLLIILSLIGATHSFRINGEMPLTTSQKKVTNLRATSTNITRELFLKNGRAQFYEDSFLYNNYFYGVTNGVIVESGACEGLRFSTSFAFQKLLAWTAVHIEGKTLQL